MAANSLILAIRDVLDFWHTCVLSELLNQPEKASTIPNQ